MLWFFSFSFCYFFNSSVDIRCYLFVSLPSIKGGAQNMNELQTQQNHHIDMGTNLAVCVYGSDDWMSNTADNDIPDGMVINGSRARYKWIISQFAHWRHVIIWLSMLDRYLLEIYSIWLLESVFELHLYHPTLLGLRDVLCIFPQNLSRLGNFPTHSLAWPSNYLHK